jgi:hypothetical protein
MHATALGKGFTAALAPLAVAEVHKPCAWLPATACEALAAAPACTCKPTAHRRSTRGQGLTSVLGAGACCWNVGQFWPVAMWGHMVSMVQCWSGNLQATILCLQRLSRWLLKQSVAKRVLRCPVLGAGACCSNSCWNVGQFATWGRHGGRYQMDMYPPGASNVAAVTEKLVERALAVRGCLSTGECCWEARCTALLQHAQGCRCGTAREDEKHQHCDCQGLHDASVAAGHCVNVRGTSLADGLTDPGLSGSCQLW